MKIRIMGTSAEVKDFEQLIKAHQNIEILEISTEYQNRGTSKYVRKYIDCRVVIPDVLSQNNCIETITINDCLQELD